MTSVHVSLIDQVLDQSAEIPNHLLKCLSTNHLSPCGSELYRCLIQQQRRELCDGSQKPASHTELDLANQWARCWRPVLHEALTSDVTLLQNNSSIHLLPCTFQVFPSAVVPLLASLDPFALGHLHAWACVVSSYRAVTGGSPWELQGSSTLETLQLALGSADDKVRLAALNLLCCSPKTKDTPTIEEMSIMRTFIPQNLNCESSPFRQHLQAGVKRFLVRIRDGCLAHVRGQKGKKKGGATCSETAQDTLEQGIGEIPDICCFVVLFCYVFMSMFFSVNLSIHWCIFCSSEPFCISCRVCGMVGSASVQLPRTGTQLSEEEDCVTVAVCSAGDLHRHLEPRKKERTTSRSVWKSSERKM